MSTPRMLRRSLIGTSLCLLAACSPDSTAPGGGGPAISVAVVPRSSSLLTSASQDFTATVTNDPSNSGVTWSITGCSGGPSACGSLSNVTNTAVTYTAPATVPPGTLGVMATAVRDNSKSFTATVAITASVAAGQIAFNNGPDYNYEIYVINADGSGLSNLTNTPNLVNDLHPAWSPDGTKIAFTRGEYGTYVWDIYLMNADGSGVHDLTNNPAFYLRHAWSPDGTKIAFSIYRDGNDEVYVMNADGSGLSNLTNNPGKDLYPAWSPDGTKIAFISDRDGNVEIYVMNADGSGATRLTNNPAADGGPIWSPDGTKIAFYSNRDGNFEVYVMNADGTGPVNLTNNPAVDGGAVWSPDGTKIAFVSDRDGIDQIYVMNADGSGAHRLTAGSEPTWRPRGP